MKTMVTMTIVFTTAVLMTADTLGICRVCRVPVFPGETVVQEEDMSIVHVEHSSLPDLIGITP